MSIITPYLNFLKRLVFADDTMLQAKHPYRQNAIREVFSWACSYTPFRNFSFQPEYMACMLVPYSTHVLGSNGTIVKYNT